VPTGRCDRGIQLTREFSAVKLWMSLKVYGAAAFREAIEHGLSLAEHAERRIAALRL
jgi:aromatic-L-amino-acid/L-tryptophan decarboxylase